jgi:hypothetical protein
MFPFALPGDEEHFRSLQKEVHKKTWGNSITPKNVYAQHHSQWEVFATTFTHQAFLLCQLKSIYDNLAVVLRILSEKQKERDPNDFGYRRSYDDSAPLKHDKGELNFASLDPFQYYELDKVDYAHRKVFLELFVSLATDRKSSKKGAIWREIGRAILENSYEDERAKLVEELTSAASAEAMNAVTGPSNAHAAIWRVRRQIVVRENAMQKALARLKELLDEEKKKAKRSVEFERPSRARSPVRETRRDRNRSWERSVSRSPVRDRRVVDFFDDVVPIRERRRSRSPPSSGDESVEIIEDRGEEV